MSWKGSVRYWRLGPFAWHVFTHALDPKARRFYEVRIGARTWQAWPPRRVLDHRNEWTCETETQLVALIAWAANRLRERAPSATQDTSWT